MKPDGLKFLRNSYLWQTISLWAFWTVAFVVQKPIFMVCYKGLFGNSSVVDWCRVCLHGFPLDISMAGYLTIVPLVLSLIAVWAPSKLIATEVLPRVALPCFCAGCAHVPAKLGALRVLGLPARFHTAVLLLLLAQRRDGECWRGRNRADGVSLLRLVAHHLFWRLLEFRLEAVLQKA